MSTNVKIGMGTRLGYHDGTDYTAVAEVVSINPSLDLGEAEATHLDSSGAEEYLAGLKSGTLSATLNYLPGTHTDLLSLYTNRTTGNWRIQYPTTDTNAGATTEVLDFPAFISNFGHTIERAEAMQGSLSLRLSNVNDITNTTDTLMS